MAWDGLERCIYEGSPEEQKYIWIYGELVHTIMEAEKSHDLLASWRPRKAGGVIQSKSEDLRPRRADDVNPSLRTGEDDMSCPSSNKEAGKKKG